MDTTTIPFNKHLGIVRPSAKEEGLLTLPDSGQLCNHLGTVHASAQFALAEACSGEILIQKFSHLGENFLPVVRKAETKYKKPAKGPLYGRATIDPDIEKSVSDQLVSKGRAIIPIHVSLVDSDNAVTMTSSIVWFVQRIEQS